MGGVKKVKLLSFESSAYSKKPGAKIIAIAVSVAKIYQVQVFRGLRPLYVAHAQFHIKISDMNVMLRGNEALVPPTHICACAVTLLLFTLYRMRFALDKRVR